MMMYDCDDDELAFADATGDDRVVGIGAGDVDEINGGGLLLRFFVVGTGTGVGWGEAVAETGERASGD